jgi:hypothetical protein
MSKFDFEEQRCSANRDVRDMKATQPFIFPEWQRIQQATDALREATKELERAQTAWDKLGKD